MKEIFLFILLILVAGFGFGQNEKIKVFLSCRCDDAYKKNTFFTNLFDIFGNFKSEKECRFVIEKVCAYKLPLYFYLKYL